MNFLVHPLFLCISSQHSHTDNSLKSPMAEAFILQTLANTINSGLHFCFIDCLVLKRQNCQYSILNLKVCIIFFKILVNFIYSVIPASGLIFLGNCSGFLFFCVSKLQMTERFLPLIEGGPGRTECICISLSFTLGQEDRNLTLCCV